MQTSFHDCYYVFTGERGPVAQPLQPHVKRWLTNTVLPRLRPLSADEYLESYAGHLTSGVASSYLAWRNRAYWVIDLEPLAVVEFAEGSLQAADLPPRQAPAWPDPEYDVIYTALDARMEGDLRHWQRFSAEAQARLHLCVSWTQALHQRLSRSTSRFAEETTHGI